jgi:ERCC4-type nuclease
MSTNISCPFTVVIDSREQTPWLFEGLTKRRNHVDVSIIVKTATRGLKTGDYSILGMENEIAIERKSVPDIIGTITRGRQRFERELERMTELKFSAVIVEGDWQTVMKHTLKNTQMNPASIDSTIIAWQMRYATQWVFRPTRFTAMKTAWKFLDRYYRDTLKEQTRGKK